MINFFKRFELPHIATYKWQWLRRVMITITIPQELARAVYGVFVGARIWWNWDGTVDNDGLPVIKL
jgi:hypothetical protein